MDLVVLVLLTLVGYSAGAVLGGRGRVVLPGLLDLGFIVLLWAAALVSHRTQSDRLCLGRWAAIGVWLVIAGLCALLWTSARRAKLPLAKQAPSPEGGSLIRHAGVAWKDFAQRLGNFQGRVFSALFYFVIAMPFAILVRAFSDPLRLKKQLGPSFWLDRPVVDTDVEALRSQF